MQPRLQTNHNPFVGEVMINGDYIFWSDPAAMSGTYDMNLDNLKITPLSSKILRPVAHEVNLHM